MKPGTRVEVVAIGDELLLGDTIETNGAWLGRRLSGLGVVVARRTVTGDDPAEIRDAVLGALQRAGTVLCTGGLGPTPDDRTRDVVARLYGRPFELDEAWLGVIRARFAARGLVMPESNRRQAQVPRGAVLFQNPAGTAPGLALEDPALGRVVLLPGPSHEVQAVFDGPVLPWLLARLSPHRPPVLRRVVRTTGLAESDVAERVADLAAKFAPLTLAFLPVGIGIDLRITSWGELAEDEAVAAVAAASRALAARLGDAVYGEGDEDLAAVVGRALAAAGRTVATAESCTGGLVMKRLTDVPGASHWTQAGIVAYSDEAKIALLGVPPGTLAAHGAVSEPVVRAMLDGARSATGADCAMAVTGIAGPAGGTPDKPVGTVWIAAAAGERAVARCVRFGGTRREIRARAAQAVLALLYSLLRSIE